MYEMYEMPNSETVKGDLNGQGQGVVGAMSGRNQISLHKGSLLALQEHAANQYPGIKICIASSADTPFGALRCVVLSCAEMHPVVVASDAYVIRDAFVLNDSLFVQLFNLEMIFKTSYSSSLFLSLTHSGTHCPGNAQTVGGCSRHDSLGLDYARLEQCRCQSNWPSTTTK